MTLIDERRVSRSRPATAHAAMLPSSFAVPKPLYSQVRDMIASQISSGQWGPGAALPNETALSQTYGVSIGTIRRAVEGLEDMGIVVRRQGRGTFVAGLGLPSVADRLCRLRGPHGDTLVTAYRILGQERRAGTPTETRALGQVAGSEVLVLSQAVLAREILIGVERSVLSAGLSAHIETSLSQGRNLYAVLGDIGLMVTRAEETVTAALADEADNHVLSVPTGRPVLQVERRAYAIDDRPVEIRISRYIPSRVSYVALSA